jgi:carboxylate-amine ligase
MLDENKWLAARHGLDATLVDLPDITRVPVPELARRLIERLRPHAEELGSAAEFDFLDDIVDAGNGAARQAVVYGANHDLREVVRELVDATVPEPAEAPAEAPSE